jgi:hypothetical protein
VTATLPKGTTDAVLRQLFPKPDPYAKDPVGWVTRKLGEHLWSKQIEIAESVRDNRHTSVQSCHGTGKSFLASRLVGWWLDSHPAGDAFVVTTAPSDHQVKAILWREISRARKRADLPGRVTQDAQWKMPVMGEEELVAYGRKPQDLTDKETAMTAFQGIHAHAVLVVLDEACGIPEWLWDACQSLVTNEHSKVLAIGNPDDPQSYFAKVCSPGSTWHTVQIGYKDTPNFTDEEIPDKLRDLLISQTWVDEAIRLWGIESATFIAKALGLFPENAEDALITASMVNDARQRDLSGEAITDPGVYGWDIGEMGDDTTEGYLNRAGMVRHVYHASKQDPITSAEDIIDCVQGHPDRRSVIDKVGVGSGTYFTCLKKGIPVYGFGAGERAIDPLRFVNRRAEAWWALRQAFIDGDVDLDPDDDELAAELQGPKWGRDSRGRVYVESKDDMRARGVKSPNRADAVVMSFVRPVAVVLDDDGSTAAHHVPDVEESEPEQGIDTYE